MLYAKSLLPLIFLIPVTELQYIFSGIGFSWFPKTHVHEIVHEIFLYMKYLYLAHEVFLMYRILLKKMHYSFEF